MSCKRAVATHWLVHGPREWGRVSCKRAVATHWLVHGPREGGVG